MSNAAIYLHRNAYDTTGARLLGRHSAGESFLRGFLRHAQVDAFWFYNVMAADHAALEATLKALHPPARPVRWIPQAGRTQMSAVGVLNLPTPELPAEAWNRRVFGANSYALTGVTHTTATATVMRLVTEMLTAPLTDHDALICTSKAVRDSVESQLDGVRDYLAAEFGPRRRPELQRVTIPLGINTADFATTPDQRKAWRERLQIPADALVALYVGRFNVRGKMSPALMALALERAAGTLGQPIWWVNAGWAEGDEAGRIYHEETAKLCPSVRYIEVDGRPADVRFSIWSVADLFISLSDNIQETFGLTPVEAMAAGLPCVVTDWNGYKDTVRHGVDGFRIPTVTPRPGMGLDLALAFSSGWLSYDNYVGAAAQYTAIDFQAAEEAIVALGRSPDLRARMGAAARARAREVFDWAAIIPQYQALWADQNARRLAAAPEPGRPDLPLRPEPFTLFAGYPTRHIARTDRIMRTPGLDLNQALARLDAPLGLYSGYNRPVRSELTAILAGLDGAATPSVAELLQRFPAGRRPYVERGLLWLARNDLVAILPQAA